MKSPPSRHHRYLALLTERLLRRTLDEQAWRARRATTLAALVARERVLARRPEALDDILARHKERVRAQLALTEPALQEMKGYRGPEEREEYTRLVAYRAALLEELERAQRASQMGVDQTDHDPVSLAG